MKVLILGAGGFIGSSLTEKIAENATDSVIAFQRTGFEQTETFHNIEYIFDDFVNIEKHFDAVEKADIIIHAISSLLPVSSSFNNEIVNVTSPTVALLDRFKNSNKHFIFISSGGSVYELNRTEPIKEEMPLQAYNFYGFSKIQLEEIFLFYHRQFQLKVTILRPSNVFGYRKRNIGVNGIISTLISNAISKKTTQVWGSGNAVRDYIHIDDFTDTVYKIAAESLDGVYNISSGNAKSVNDIIAIVNKFSPHKCIIDYRENLYHLPEFIVLSNDKITKAIPGDKQSCFEEKINELVLKYSENN